MRKSLCRISGQNSSDHTLRVEIGVESAETSSVLLVDLDVLYFLIELVCMSIDQSSKKGTLILPCDI